MQRITLEQIQFQNANTLYRLKKFLDNLSVYNSADPNMKLVIYCSQPDNDFMGLEASEYMLDFQSSDYLLSDFMTLSLNRCDTTFRAFRRFLS